jgi:GTP diphosphokinase / guanosine-3',5'-bis(diphosphate) 3'-diphosphatase
MPITSPAVDSAVGRSELVREALVLAREAHAGQTRNASGGRPYIDHPVAVAERLAELGRDDEVLAAALLHDVVEDSDLEVGDVRRACGERVAAIVEALTDDQALASYEERKREHRGRVEAAGADALAIYAADKLTNVEMLRDAYATRGEDVAEELTVPLDVKVGVWGDDLAMLERSAGGDAGVTALAARLSAQLAELDRSRRGMTTGSRG